ncbi:hypothetical protein IWQ61_001392 [Dispira simplex]|nr:hypothetical protein IWQ61_001392 [Dispira simplex]
MDTHPYVSPHLKEPLPLPNGYVTCSCCTPPWILRGNGSLHKHLLRQGLAVTTFPPSPASISSDSANSYIDEYHLETPTKTAPVRKQPSRELYAVYHVDGGHGKRKIPCVRSESDFGEESDVERDEALDEVVVKLQGLIDHFVNGKQPGRATLWACGCKLFQVDPEAGPHQDVIQYWRRGDREAYMRSNVQYRERCVSLAQNFLNAFPHDVKRLRDLLKQRKKNGKNGVIWVMDDVPKSLVTPKRGRLPFNRNSMATDAVVVVIPERRPRQEKPKVIVIRDKTPDPSISPLQPKKVDMVHNSPIILRQGISAINHDFIKFKRTTKDSEIKSIVSTRDNTSVLSTPKRRRCS